MGVATGVGVLACRRTSRHGGGGGHAGASRGALQVTMSTRLSRLSRHLGLMHSLALASESDHLMSPISFYLRSVREKIII